MVIQSSSATTVMLVSFVQAGLMTFMQTLGVILGADIGTTVTAQLIAFKLTDYALLMIAIGFGLRMFSKSENIKNIGEVILGFGILFFGMKLMSDTMRPLRSYPDFINLLKGLENPVLGLLVGAAFTALIQSSSAFTGILIVLAQQKPDHAGSRYSDDFRRQPRHLHYGGPCEHRDLTGSQTRRPGAYSF
jgi:phosphate:Na+ symporter